jgi:hypothetical protein
VPNPESLVRQRLETSTGLEAEAERASNRLGNIRLALALVTLVLLLLPLAVRSSWPWWSLIPIGAVFVALGIVDDRVTSRRRRWSAARRHWRGELDRFEEKWRELPDDGADVSPRDGLASLATDLDLFGPASLFQLVSRAHTPHGRRVIAQWLVRPAEVKEIAARQQAVKELAKREDLREALAVAASAEGEGRLSDEKLLAWGEHPQPLPFGGPLRVIAIGQPLVLFAGAIAWLFGAPLIVLVVPVLVQIAVILAIRGAVSERAEVLSSPDRALSRYADLIETIEKSDLGSPALSAIKARLSTEGESASSRIRRLHRLVEMLEASRNMFFALSLGPILLWDLNVVLRAEGWQKSTGKRLRGWFEAIGEVEALASFGAFSAERPDYGFPTFSSAPGVFRSSGIAHPLIDRRRVVANDLTLDGPGSVLLLSGSNMSGKSTLLRAIGVNVVLAEAGAPVAATSLEMSPSILTTSIRVTDSLARGASHFYAELQRIKSAVDVAAKEGPRLLYLLDEMLHGTNSKERYIGAVSVIRWLSGRGAFGVVTTHDLALSRVAEELPGKVTNLHFGDEVVENQIRFDYKLKPGPVVSTNALRLMRAIGIDIELSAPE